MLSNKTVKRIFIFLILAIFLPVLIICVRTPSSDNQLEDGLKGLFSGDLGHTLIGAKPVSCEDWFWYKSGSPQLKEKVITFLKKNFANSKTFIICINDPYPILVDITLVNKPLLTKTIRREKYLSDFIRKYYGSPDRFFKKLEDSRANIFKLLHFDDRALGLAFGYGKTNTSYAFRRMEIQYFLRYGNRFCGYLLRSIPRPSSITKFCVLPPHWTDLPKYGVKPSTGFCSLEEELEYLKSLEYNAQEFGSPYLFVPPCFIAKRCQETDRLLNHYKKSTDKLAKIYIKKPFSQFLTEQCTHS